MKMMAKMIRPIRMPINIHGKGFLYNMKTAFGSKNRKVCLVHFNCVTSLEGWLANAKWLAKEGFFAGWNLATLWPIEQLATKTFCTFLQLQVLAHFTFYGVFYLLKNFRCFPQNF